MAISERTDVPLQCVAKENRHLQVLHAFVDRVAQGQQLADPRDDDYHRVHVQPAQLCGAGGGAREGVQPASRAAASNRRMP